MTPNPQLDRIRDILAFGGGAFFLIYSLILAVRFGPDGTRSLLIAIPIVLGSLLIGAGAFARKMRRWMYKTEERLRKLEEADRK